ncbi:MAG: hypothetical protein QF741_01300 [Candidatus Peribacteraceae bacterium]|jgi:hypothetical protein|nr:hypothetical protein [Candidatus Peribacteraceae bacterium]MDP7453973.1 hypothetical protein [Candidatus Peribacteraceae bacterium]MDP7645620.1 hypothetical protein [Candidatus Peribacteraceae bacterium]
MLKIANLALIGIFSFALFASSASAYFRAPDTISYGTHPWDVRPRRHYEYSKIDPYRYSKDYFYMHPDRSKTHALHPYHRDRYYAPPIDPEVARYSSRRISDVQYSEVRAYVPKVDRLTYCDSYSFRRPSYRIPPYQYFCR